jgi:hypothetical protein
MMAEEEDGGARGHTQRGNDGAAEELAGVRAALGDDGDGRNKGGGVAMLAEIKNCAMCWRRR